MAENIAEQEIEHISLNARNIPTLVNFTIRWQYMHESSNAFPAQKPLFSRSNPEMEVCKVEMFIRENNSSNVVVVLWVGIIIPIIVVVVL